jgi:hypothetical protein
MLSLHLSCANNYKLQLVFSQILFEVSFWVKTQSKEPKRAFDVKFHHKKFIYLFFGCHLKLW